MQFFLVIFLYFSTILLRVCDSAENSEESARSYFRDAENTTMFYLFSPLNPTLPQILSLHNSDALQNSNLNVDLPTRILIDGWYGNNRSAFNINLRKAYIQKGSYNVIVADWEEGSATTSLPLAVKNTKISGKVIGNFIDKLVDELSIDLSTLYMIGFGLGGHAAGFAGKQVTLGKISTIIALDPTGTEFYQLEKPDERLSSSDANYVQVIHTNAYVMGFPHAIGHADFYANYGIVQPECDPTNCSNRRSYEYFVESVNSEIGFAGQKCSNYKEILLNASCTGDNLKFKYQVGGEPVREYSGIFQFKTGSGYPYSRVFN